MISKNDFSFRPLGAGHYQVTYQSPKTFKKWVKTVTDMTIIDATKNTDEPTKVDLNRLKSLCKWNPDKIIKL